MTSWGRKSSVGFSSSGAYKALFMPRNPIASRLGVSSTAPPYGEPSGKPKALKVDFQHGGARAMSSFKARLSLCHLESRRLLWSRPSSWITAKTSADLRLGASASGRLSSDARWNPLAMSFTGLFELLPLLRSIVWFFDMFTQRSLKPLALTALSLTVPFASQTGRRCLAAVGLQQGQWPPSYGGSSWTGALSFVSGLGSSFHSRCRSPCCHPVRGFPHS